MSDDDLLCPECHHPLGLHQYFYGTCQAPIGGIFNHEQCGCIVTLHDLIANLQARDLTKKIEELQASNKSYMDDIIKARRVMVDALGRIHFLEALIEGIATILGEAKATKETRPFYGWFAEDYRDEMHKIIDRALLETEKINA